MLIALVLVATAIVYLPSPVLAISGTANLSAPSGINQGATGTITVSIASTNIGAFELFITVGDPSVIRFDSITAGSISSAVSYTPSSAIANGFHVSGITGGIAATIGFTAIGDPGASTSIDISGTMNESTPPSYPAITTTFTGVTISINVPLPQHILNMGVSPAGAGATSPSAGAHTYDEGQVVSISASPSTGWTFSHWEGDAASLGTQNTTVTMSGDKSATAVFVEIPMFTLITAVNGQGTITPAPGSYDHYSGDVVPVTATPAEGWRFVNWSGGVTNPTAAATSVIVDANKTITANFSPRDSFALTIMIEGQGTTSPAAGTHTYARDAVVNVIATPAAGYKFDRWLGEVANANSAATTVTINADKTITARFVAVTTYKLTLEVNGNGTTNPAPGNHDYPEGTLVTISAIGDDGYIFDGWKGGVASVGASTTTVLMDGNKTVTANFSALPTAPQFIQIGVQLVTRSAAVITWEVDIPATGRVEYWHDGASWRETPLDPSLATRHTLRLEGLEPGKTYHFVITAIGAAGAESVSLENTFATAYNAAAFVISGWDSLVEETGSTKKVTVNLVVTNTGDLPGGYGVTLKVNGVAEESRTVTLEPGTETGVSFVTTCAQVGTYAIDVNGFGLNVEVFPPKKDPIIPGPVPLHSQIGEWVADHWVPVLGVVAGLVLLLVLAAVIIGRLYHVVFTIIRR
jgi:uncharacterized repeat protein (TIGR02543 family)